MSLKEDKLLRQLGYNVIMSRFFIKSKTNANEHAKQYFIALENDDYESCLIVRKLVLSSDERLCHDFEILREYKGKFLFEQRFSIKLETLSNVLKVLNPLHKVL